MHQTKKIIIAIAIVAVLIIAAFGLTYAFVLPQLSGLESTNTVNIRAAEALTVNFKGETKMVFSNHIAPGWTQEKTFSIVNNTNSTITYNINFADVENTLVHQSDLVFTLTSTNGGGSISETPVPNDNDDVKLTNIVIPAKSTQEYTLSLEYKNAEYEQSDDLGKIFSFAIEIN